MHVSLGCSNVQYLILRCNPAETLWYTTYTSRIRGGHYPPETVSQGVVPGTSHPCGNEIVMCTACEIAPVETDDPTWRPRPSVEKILPRSS